MRWKRQVAVGILAVSVSGCQGVPFIPGNLSHIPKPEPVRSPARPHAVPFSTLATNYLVRPDTGERRILRQLVHELQLNRHLIDEAYAHRDEHARVRVDYARLSAEFNQMISGLQQILAATETAPRDSDAIWGEYRTYE